MAPVEIALVAFVQSLTAAEQFWPVTGSGWLTFFGAVLTLGYLLYDRLFAKAKRDNELNGLGDRVNAVEDWQKRYDAGALERDRIQQNIIRTQNDMLRELGEAHAASRQCQADTKEMVETLTKLITRNHEYATAASRRTAVQVYGLITELRARGQIADQPPASPPLPDPPFEEP